MSGGCLKGEWECAVSDYECLVKALVIMMIDKVPNNGINPQHYLPKSFLDFWKSLEGCRDGVWKCLEGISGVSS